MFAVEDAVKKAKNIAGLSENAKVVTYRRSKFPDDTLYNPSTAQSPIDEPTFIDLGISDYISQLIPGFYYVWTPALGM